MMRGLYRFKNKHNIIVLFLENSCGIQVSSDYSYDNRNGKYDKCWWDNIEKWEYLASLAIDDLGI